MKTLFYRLALLALATLILVLIPIAVYLSDAAAYIPDNLRIDLGPKPTPGPTRQMEMSNWGSIQPASGPEYNEDLIVDLISEIYRTLLRLGPWEEQTVIWPPEGGHKLNYSRVWKEGVKIDGRVATLMQRLPLGRGSGPKVAPSFMVAVDFLDADSLYYSRFIDERDFWLRSPEPAPSTVLWLFKDDNEDRPIVVLDVADNTIRYVREAEYLRDAYTEWQTNDKKLDDYRCNYKNWPAMSAPDYLRSMLRMYREAIWIPTRSSYIAVYDPNEPDDPRYPEFKTEANLLHRLLLEVYGWPDDFQEEAWKRDVHGESRELPSWKLNQES